MFCFKIMKYLFFLFGYFSVSKEFNYWLRKYNLFIQTYSLKIILGLRKYEMLCQKDELFYEIQSYGIITAGETPVDLNNLYGLTIPSDKQRQTCARPNGWRWVKSTLYVNWSPMIDFQTKMKHKFGNQSRFKPGKLWEPVYLFCIWLKFGSQFIYFATFCIHILVSNF